MLPPLDPQSATRFYDHPIWYDLVHQKGTAWEVGFIRRMAERWVDTGTDLKEQLWLEPACGTGRFVRQLAKSGQRVVGYDLNERSVQFARRKLRQDGVGDRVAEVCLDSMTEFCRPQRFDYAFNTINTFRHLMNVDDAARHLELTAESLKPGGIYLLGIDIVDYEIPEPMEETWKAKRAGSEVTHVMMTIPPARAQRWERIINHITIRTGGGRGGKEHYYESTYDLFTYDLKQWRKLIHASPFRVVEAYDFAHEKVERIDDRSRDLNMVLQMK